MTSIEGGRAELLLFEETELPRGLTSKALALCPLRLLWLLSTLLVRKDCEAFPGL